jgi:flagellar hook-associated protein 2
VSDISIPGVNSKYGTQTIIENLVKVERNKLVQMEAEKKDFEDTKVIWQDTNRRMQSVRDAARALYGFNTPFGAKVGSSSDDKSVGVLATRAASDGTYQVKVLRQASNDRFLSKSLPLDQTLAPGEYRFKVGEKELVINFKGGKVSNFVDAVNLKDPTLLKASVIRDTSDTQILQLEAVPVGAKNSLGMSAAALDELTKVGMVGPSKGDGQVLLSDPVTLAPGEKQSWKPNPALTVAPGMELHMTVNFTSPAADAAPPLPTGFAYPDGGTMTYQGITLSGAGMQGQVPPPPVVTPPPEVRTLKGLSVQSGGKSVPLGDLPDSTTATEVSMVLPAGADLSSIDLANGNSGRSIVVSKVEIVDPSKKDGVEPQHAISRAGDAQLEFEGIKILRDTNAVADVVPGVTLNLLAPSTDPVTVKVEPDRKAIKDTVIAFLAGYNRLVTDILVLTTIKPDNPASSPILQDAVDLTDDDKKKAESRLGKFQGDIGLNQLKNTMQRIMMDPYKTDGSPFTLLAQIGISTNSSPGAGSDRVNTSKLRGYMEMDEAKFDAAVAQDLNGVKKLFGNSLDGTLIVNSGAAYSIDELLKPSTQLGGFNAMKISSLDSQIKSKTQEMADYNDYLARYQQDLKRKYGQMEASLNAMNKNAQSLSGLGGNGN